MLKRACGGIEIYLAHNNVLKMTYKAPKRYFYTTSAQNILMHIKVLMRTKLYTGCVSRLDN